MILRPNLLCVSILATAAFSYGNTNDSYADYADASYGAGSQTYPSGGASYDPAQNDSYGMEPTHYDMSGSGAGQSNLSLLLPEQTFYEYLGPMSHRNGTGHATLANWSTRFNLANATSGSWRFNVDSAFRMTWFDAGQEAAMDVDNLYTIWLNMSASYKLWGSTRLTFGVTPEFSSDFDSWVARNFNMGAHLFLSSKLSDKFKYRVGIAYAPQLGDIGVLPVVGFSWQTAPNWMIDLQGVRLSAMNKVTDYFSWGPFVSVVSGAWIVKHERSHARFEWMSGVAGIATELGLGKWGSVHPKLLADAGFSFANRARFMTTNGKHELEEKTYDPGFYMRAGISFSF